MSAENGRFRAFRGLVGLILALGAASTARPDDAFPAPRPTSTDEAVRVLAGEPGISPAVRRAVAYLRSPGTAPDRGRVLETSAGVRVRAITDRAASERPDLHEATALGIEQAHDLLVDRLRLSAPDGIEVLFLETRGQGEAVNLPRRGVPRTIVIEAAPDQDAEATRRAAIRHYGRAVAHAAGPVFPESWATALAEWAVMEIDGGPDDSGARLLSLRLDRLNEGLDATDPEMAAGNAAWFAFLDQLYGPHALRFTVEELGRVSPAPLALERAVVRAAGQSLPQAFREFHIWSLMRGDRADRWHFSFAGQLGGPRWASSSEGLPALSVHADPAVAPWGATQVRILPGERPGGLHLEFEGDFVTTWEVDLLLTDSHGIVRRLPLSVLEGRGEATVPLDGLAEALLLVRNLGGDEGQPRRYTYSTHAETGYPFELVSLDAVRSEPEADGVLVTWETASEQDLVGYNLLRTPEDGGSTVTVNPVWVPALGRPGVPTVYRFLDRSADPGTAYVYHVQGVTSDGLSSRSDSTSVRPATRRSPR